MFQASLNKLSALLWSSRFFRDQVTKIEQRNTVRLQKWGQENPVVNLSIPLTLLTLFSIAGFFVFNFYGYSSWPPPVYNDPQVFNLTKNKIEWNVHYGESPRCGEIDCHVDPHYPIENFERRQVLPVTEFPLNGLNDAKTIYYRTTIKLNPDMRKLGTTDTVEIHALQIWGDRFEVFIDGILMDVGSNEMLQMAIPQSALSKESFDIAIKVIPGHSSYQGVANYGQVVIGPKKVLAPLRYIYFDRKVVFYTWLLLPKLAFALFFGFVYLAFSQNRENYHFLIYAVLTSAEIFVASDYVRYLPTFAASKVTMRIIQILTQITLLKFFVRYFRQPSGVKNMQQKLAPTVAGIVGLSLAMNLGGVPFIKCLRIGSLVFNLFVLGTGLFYALESSTYLFMTRRSNARLRATLPIAAALFPSAVLVAMRLSYEIGELLGFVQLDFLLGSTFLERVIDLTLFFTLASAVAAEFGNTARMRLATSNSLKEFVGHDVAEKLLHDSVNVAKTEDKITTIMFTDIRSFTTISETETPTVIVETLNEYFETMAPIIESHGGHIDKYIGDSIMAVWGIGTRSNSHPVAAVRAAIAMREALDQLNQKRRERGLFELRVGIGIHAGHTVAGAVGSKQRKDYTVIGDAVNSAARIQDQTKAEGFDILIGEPVMAACREVIWSIPCGAIQLKGRKAEIQLYKLVAVAGSDGTPHFGDPKLAATCNEFIGRPPGVIADVLDDKLQWPHRDEDKKLTA